MNDNIELKRKKTGKICTFFSSHGEYIVLKDADGRQHHMRIDELARDFDCPEQKKWLATVQLIKWPSIRLGVKGQNCVGGGRSGISIGIKTVRTLYGLWERPIFYEGTNMRF